MFETIFHGNGRNMTNEKEFHYQEKNFVSDLFCFLIYFIFNYFLFDLNNSKQSDIQCSKNNIKS